MLFHITAYRFGIVEEGFSMVVAWRWKTLRGYFEERSDRKHIGANLRVHQKSQAAQNRELSIEQSEFIPQEVEFLIIVFRAVHRKHLLQGLFVSQKVLYVLFGDDFLQVIVQPKPILLDLVAHQSRVKYFLVSRIIAWMCSLCEFLHTQSITAHSFRNFCLWNFFSSSELMEEEFVVRFRVSLSMGLRLN